MKLVSTLSVFLIAALLVYWVAFSDMGTVSFRTAGDVSAPGRKLETASTVNKGSDGNESQLASEQTSSTEEPTVDRLGTKTIERSRSIEAFNALVDSLQAMAPADAYDAVMTALTSLERPTESDDPVQDAMLRAGDALLDKAIVDNILFDRALEDLTLAENANQQELAWDLVVNGCARNNLFDASEDIYAAYASCDDRRIQMFICWNIGACRDSSIGLRIAREELLFTKTPLSTKAVYPGIETAFKALRSVIRSEATSRDTYRKKREIPNAKIHAYFVSEEAIPDSRPEALKIATTIANDPRITPEEMGISLALIKNLDETKILDVGASVGYFDSRTRGILERYQDNFRKTVKAN